MGEAKRRREIGLPPRLNKIENKESNVKLKEIINKVPYLSYILFFSLLAILIFDLVNYYK